MQLRKARLCLDCEEVHDADQCPSCASESFIFLSRWVPVDDRRTRPRPAAPEEVDVYRRLTSEEPAPSKGARLLKQGVVGLAALGVVGWLWGTRETAGAKVNGGKATGDSEKADKPKDKQRAY